MWFIKYFTFVGCIFSVFCDEVVQYVLDKSEIDINLLQNIVIYGIASESVIRQANISSMCTSEFTKILKGINKKDMWALKVMDASGTYQSSFVWGNNAWLGSKVQCDFLNTPPKFTTSPDIPKLMDKDLISTITPMEMNYKMIFLIITSPYKIDPVLKAFNTHRLGLCLPKSCSNNEIMSLSKSFFSQQKLTFQKLYNATMEVINVRDMNLKNFLNRPEVTRILFTIGFVAALVIVFSFANRYVEDTDKDGLKRFFKCFSIYDNVHGLYDTSSSPNAINSVNGIRSIICLWVLISHCGYFTMHALDNLQVYVAAWERFELQPLFAAIMLVDVFFVLSAFLLVFNFLKDEQTLTEIRNSNCIQQIKLFAKKIIHRYIRLTPAFLFTIGISHVVSVYIQESSSLYIDESFDAYCKKKALWNSVFYIHNLFRAEDMCTSWAWYLACDMQYYIAILIILFINARSPALAQGLFVALFVLISVIGIHSNIKINLLPRVDSLFYHYSDFYIGPIDRMHPYLAGATVGYVMFRVKDNNFKKSNFVTILYWAVSIPTIFASLFLMALKESSNLNFTLALSFGRCLLGLFVGSMIFMCHFGYGGIINKMMSSRFFVHVNKTTYMMYLLSPTLILYFNSNKESSSHFDVASLTAMAFGIVLMSYLAAIVISPIFEIPFQKLSDEYIMKRSKTNSISHT